MPEDLPTPEKSLKELENKFIDSNKLEIIYLLVKLWYTYV